MNRSRVRRALFCLVMAFSPVMWSPGFAEDWPQWRGPRADSTWNGPELPETFPEGGLRTVWKQPIGGGYGGIAVVEGRAYVQDHRQEPEAERLLCYEDGTGKLLWEITSPVAYNKLDYGNGPRATPTVHGDKVYAFGALGHLVCADRVSGKVLWRKDPQHDYKVVLPEWGLAGSPVIWENLVIAHPGAGPGACLIAFEKNTGREVWRTGDDPGGYGTPIVIPSPSGPQLVLWAPEHIFGFDPRTGKEFWKIPYSVMYGVSIATPLYQEGLVLVSGYWAGSKAIRLGPQPTDAKIEWEENKFLRGLMCPPIYREGLVYSLDKQYGLTCFELASGKKLWDDDNKMTPRGRNPQANVVWLDGGRSERTIVLNSEGELIMARLNRAGYHETARTKIIDPTWAHPAFAGQFVFARNDTEIVCVELLAK